MFGREWFAVAGTRSFIESPHLGNSREFERGDQSCLRESEQPMAVSFSAPLFGANLPPANGGRYWSRDVA